jgi:hypothetical protein
MIEAPPNNTNEERIMYAIVPLNRPGLLCQAGLFDQRRYALPKVLPGSYAVITDADQWQDNFKRGMVTAYSYETGVHTIQIDSVEELGLFGREIRKAKAQEKRP